MTTPYTVYKPCVAASLRNLAFGCTVAAVAAGAFALAPSSAQAQGYYGGGGFSFWNDPPPRPRKVVRNKPRVSKSNVETEVTVLPDVKPEGPLLLSISIKKQRIGVYDAKGLVTEAPISSGRVGYATPTGVFSILEKNKVHHSNLYGGAPMPNMQRITWSGVALHAGDLPGYPASHGCIRLPRGFSAKLFGMTKYGTRVVVTRDPIAPQSFESDKLFTALPPEVEPTTADAGTAATEVADASPGKTDANVGGVLGVTPAAAAEVAVDPSVVGARWRADRKAEMARLADAETAATAKKDEILARAKEVAAASDQLKAPVRLAQLELDRVIKDTRKVIAAREGAADDLRSFSAKLIKSGIPSDPAAVAQLAEREDQLETQALDSADNAKLAAKRVEDAKAAVSAAQATLAAMEAERRAIVDELKVAGKAADDAKAAHAAAKRRETKRNMPVSVFVSRKTQRLYVRQGYEPILEVPVTFAQPDQPVGTHVFTALATKENKIDMTWSALSIQTHSAAPEPTGRRKRDKKSFIVPPPYDPAIVAAQTATAALERFTIPAEVREQLADVMKPGSSLVISDLGMGNETGKFTDFIIQTR